MEICLSFGLGLWKNHINLWIVEVRRVKPQLVENKQGIIKLYDVKKN